MKRDVQLQEGGQIRLPAIGFGTSALGNTPKDYGYDVDTARAHATLSAILDLENGFIDTSRIYGEGRSEERIGAAIAERGGLPPGRVLATKLDRDLDMGRFDAAQARCSVEASLKALGVDQVQILHLHDPEFASDPSEVTRDGGALDELMKMKEEGLAGTVGLAAGDIDVMLPLLRDWDFDFVLTHNRFTLLNRDAEPLIALAHSRGMGVFNAAPYAGGTFAKGTDKHQRYVYREADEATLLPIRRIEAICSRHGVPTGALALQFSLRDPRITSTICGVSRPERVAETLAWAALKIPEEIWEEIATLP